MRRMSESGRGAGLTMRCASAAVVAGCVLAASVPARADDAALEATVRVRPVVAVAHLRPDVELDGARQAEAVDVRALLESARQTEPVAQMRIDGLLFAEFASVGLVVLQQPGSDALAPRPTAGLSPRLLRGGGVLCDVRLVF